MRPSVFRVIDVSLGRVDSGLREIGAAVDLRDAVSFDEMDRLLFFWRHPDSGALGKEVWFDRAYQPEPSPERIPTTARDSMQLVYTIFPRLEKAGSSDLMFPMVPPRRSLPCCQTLHTIHNLFLLTRTQGPACRRAVRCANSASRVTRSKEEVLPPVPPFRLETLDVWETHQLDWEVVSLRTFLRACGPTLKHLRLGLNYNDVPDFSILPNLATLGVHMSDRDGEQVDDRSVSAWFTVALRTCVALERLTIETNYVGLPLPKTPQGLLAMPEVAAADPEAYQFRHAASRRRARSGFEEQQKSACSRNSLRGKYAGPQDRARSLS